MSILVKMPFEHFKGMTSFGRRSFEESMPSWSRTGSKTSQGHLLREAYTNLQKNPGVYPFKEKIIIKKTESFKDENGYADITYVSDGKLRAVSLWMLDYQGSLEVNVEESYQDRLHTDSNLPTPYINLSIVLDTDDSDDSTDFKKQLSITDHFKTSMFVERGEEWLKPDTIRARHKVEDGVMNISIPCYRLFETSYNEEYIALAHTALKRRLHYTKLLSRVAYFNITIRE